MPELDEDMKKVSIEGKFLRKFLMGILQAALYDVMFLNDFVLCLCHYLIRPTATR